ncbi:unnamed protein product [Rotaria socialis]|uniref:Uncharacterized protein n=1 Tax=Rotaria socialis TaxID=392032 RepID=A0A818GTZ1_9BILA|nr:unnamed protein product [Rotaria socialis]
MFISSIRPYQSAGEIKCSQSSKLRCSGTNKCILKRHIMDGIRHCYNGFDESIAANSCLLNDRYRFQFTSGNKCILPTLLGDMKY